MLSAQERLEGSEALSQRVVELAKQLKCVTVAMYAAHRDEASLWPAFDWLLTAGVVVALPRVADTTMSFHRVTSADALVDGYRGIREPGPACELLAASEMGLLLVPGLAFDHNGGRLGQGGGHYDRFLAGTLVGGPVVGVGFECQRHDGPLPSESHDYRVDALVTEVGTYMTALSGP